MIKTNRICFIRCDANEIIGYGHLFRCLSIAENLRDYFSWEVFFISAASKKCEAIIKEKNFKLFNYICNDRSKLSREKLFLSMVSKLEPTLVIFDLRTNYDLSTLIAIKSQKIIIASLDDPTDIRNYCDASFYPPVPQIKKMDWSSFRGELNKGWEWIAIGNEIKKYRDLKLRQFSNIGNEVKKNLKCCISMGGSDPSNLTLLILNEVDKRNVNLDITVIIGPDFIHFGDLEIFLKNANNTYSIVRDPENIYEIFYNMDFAIISFGTTAYELAAIGTPFFFMSISEDHAESASIFDNFDCVINLGLVNNYNTGALLNFIQKDSFKNSLFLRSSRNLLEQIDGMGSMRIAERLNALAFLKNKF